MLAMLLQMSAHGHARHDGPQALVAATTQPTQCCWTSAARHRRHEVARRLRRGPWAATCLLLAVTGWGQLPDRQATTDAGSTPLVKAGDPEC